MVRGADLLDSTPRQIYLQRCLGLPAPAYLHLPVAVNREGQKLSKQTKAPAVRDEEAGPTLWRVLEFLGQGPPPGLHGARPAELLAWAIRHWAPSMVPRGPLEET